MDSQVAAVGEEKGGDRWDNSFQEVDESREKLESVKVAVVSAVVRTGTVALLQLLFSRNALLSTLTISYDLLPLTYQRGCRLAGEEC